MKDGQTNVPKIEKDSKEAQRAKEMKVNDSEMVRDLKTQLKYDSFSFYVQNKTFNKPFFLFLSQKSAQ